MNVRDLENALVFLRRVIARGEEEEVLFRTVKHIEAEVQRRKRERQR